MAFSTEHHVIKPGPEKYFYISVPPWLVKFTSAGSTKNVTSPTNIFYLRAPPKKITNQSKFVAGVNRECQILKLGVFRFNINVNQTYSKTAPLLYLVFIQIFKCYIVTFVVNMSASQMF